MKGYNQTSNEKYLFCSCIDRSARVVERKEGTQTNSYDNLLVKCSAVISNLSKLDYIFHMPLSTIDNLEQPTKSIGGQLKSPPEEMLATVEEETRGSLLDETMEAGIEFYTKEASVDDETIVGVVEETMVVEEERMKHKDKMVVAGVEKGSIIGAPSTTMTNRRTKRKRAQEGRERISVASGNSF